MKGTSIINGFSEKKYFGGKWAILDSKMVHPHNSGFVLRMFLKFCTMKRANSWMKLILTVFTKKKLFKAKGPF